jgi:predicted RNA-binding Zn ribbon-like protein
MHLVLVKTLNIIIMKTNLTLARERKLHFKNMVSPQYGGIPALNFVNTLKKRGSDKPKDYLTSYEDFVYWCYQAKIIDYDHYHQLSSEAYCYAHEAAGVFEQVINTRFMLYEIFLSVIKGEPADEIFMRQFNLEIDNSSKYLRYVSTANGIGMAWLNIDEEIAAPLWMIVQSAAELLVRGNPKKIKPCKTCGSVFFDRTKNGTRNWCNPSACGKVLKNQRYYHAKKEIKERDDNSGYNLTDTQYRVQETTANAAENISGV